MRSRRGTEHCGGRIGARLGCSLLRHLDGAIRSTTPPRRRDTRLPEPCSWKTDAAIAPVASVAAFLIFTSRACGAAWRQALAGSTLRSSARRRRGPLRSRGTVAEARAGVLHSKNSESFSCGAAHRNARESGGRRSHRAPVPRAQPEPPSLAASHRSSRVGQLSGPGAAKEHRTPSTRRKSRDAQHSARGKWLPRQTPPT